MSLLPSDLFNRPVDCVDGVHLASTPGATENEAHSSDAFSEKWTTLDQAEADRDEGWKQAQYRWYLDCYGYPDEAAFAAFLADKSLILDAGCGPGYKAAWMAGLAPHATVIGMDLSQSVFLAARRYNEFPNLVWVRGDIANTPFKADRFDFVSCDQVLHHTDNPPATVAEFARILTAGGSLNTYVYASKALPRELLDEHFRELSKHMSHDEIWALSEQLTVLGRNLSDLKVDVEVPDIPALGIVGGRMDVQRFIYWNFLKCFLNPEFGHDASRMVNFDWYAPSTAFRYTAEQFQQMIEAAGFRSEYLHSEEACHTGRFAK